MPPGILDWMQSFEILTTALVGSEAVSLGVLLVHQGHIRTTDDHGPTHGLFSTGRCPLQAGIHGKDCARSLSEEDEADLPWGAVFD